MAFVNPMPIRVPAQTEIFSSRRIFRGGSKTHSTGGRTELVRSQRSRKCEVRCLLQEAGDRSNVCSPTHDFHLRPQKFSMFWPRMHTARSRTFSGGYSTLAFGTGRRKLRRPSHNSSNTVSSKKSYLRTAKYFTTSLRVISPLFSSSHHETLLLTQLHKSPSKKGPSCPPR